MGAHGCGKKETSKCDVLPEIFLSAKPKPGESKPCPLLRIFLGIREGWQEVIQAGREPQPPEGDRGDICSAVVSHDPHHWALMG